MPCASSSSSRAPSRHKSPATQRVLYTHAGLPSLRVDPDMTDSCDRQEFKVVIVGDHRVGKTSILRCWRGDFFEPFSKATIGFDLCSGDYHFSDGGVRLQVWDTAGQEKFNSVTTVQFRNAKVIVFVYDVSSRPSFERIADYWLSRVDAFVDEPVPIFLVANKMDLPPAEHQVTSEEGQRLATAQGASGFYETSAKDGRQIEELFESVARVALKTWSVIRDESRPRSFCQHCGHSDEYSLNVQRRGRKLEDVDGDATSRPCCAGPRPCAKAQRSPFERRTLPMS